MSAVTSAVKHAPVGPTNVDASEVDRYARLAHRWWDRSGPFWPLHQLNGLRTSYLQETITQAFNRSEDVYLPLRGLRILDVGCGGGILSESMAHLGATVHGIDVVRESVESARLHAAQSQLAVRYDCISVSTLSNRGSTYDVVLNMEVVEHVPNVPEFLRACAGLVRSGGLMAVATINRTALAWLFAIVGAEYVLRWLPKGTHRWQQFVKPSEIGKLLNTNGCQTLAETGVRVNPINRQFTLSRAMAVNYMLIARRCMSTVNDPTGLVQSSESSTLNLENH